MTPVYDRITKHFSCATGCSIRDEVPRIEMIDPCDPLRGRNLEYRENFQIISVTGLDDMADIELTTERSIFRDGVITKGSRRKEKTISIVVKVCECEDCDMVHHRRELYEIADCSFCNDGSPFECCLNCNLCYDHYTMKNPNQCLMRVRCCGVVRDISVQRTRHSITKRGSCEFHRFDYVADNPNLFFPQVQTVEMTVDEDELICPVYVCGPDINLPQIYRFEKCITIPYAGDVTGFPKITITGDARNIRITNSATGAVLDLNNQETNFDIGGRCGVTTLSFWPGQQQFVDARGNNIYADLSAGCNSNFYFPGGCGDVEFCVEVDSFDRHNFRMKVQWWDEFDGFFAARYEPQMSDPCDGDVFIEDIDFTIEPEDIVCPECLQSCAEDGNLCYSNYLSFSKCYEIPYPGEVVGHPTVNIIGHVENLRITNLTTGSVVMLQTGENPGAAGFTTVCDFGDPPGCGAIEICIEGDCIDPDELHGTITWPNINDTTFTPPNIISPFTSVDECS